ncbi:lactate dehydrogenase, partial [Mycoplasmopsis pullorum]
MDKLIKNSLGFDSDLYIYQDKSMFNYSVDTILLGNFVKLSNKITRILEIGTNNGALSVFLAARNKNNRIVAVEIQERAVQIAQKNVELNKMTDQIQLINQDFNIFYKEWNKNNNPKFQSIVCNPPFYPYDKTKSKTKSSMEKLIATHEIHLNLDQLICGASKLLKQKGYLSL